jgi:hypothetical protein
MGATVESLVGIAVVLVIWWTSIRLREHYRRKAEEKARRNFLWKTLRPAAGVFPDDDSEPPPDWQPPGG